MTCCLRCAKLLDTLFSIKQLPMLYPSIFMIEMLGCFCIGMGYDSQGISLACQLYEWGASLLLPASVVGRAPMLLCSCSVLSWNVNRRKQERAVNYWLPGVNLTLALNQGESKSWHPAQTGVMG